MSVLAHTKWRLRNSATSPPIDTTGAKLIVITAGWWDQLMATPIDSKGNVWASAPVANPAGPRKSQIWWTVPTVTGTGHTFTCNANPGGADINASYAVAAFDGITNPGLDTSREGYTNGQHDFGAYTAPAAGALAVMTYANTTSDPGVADPTPPFTLIEIETALSGGMASGLAAGTLTAAQTLTPKIGTTPPPATYGNAASFAAFVSLPPSVVFVAGDAATGNVTAALNSSTADFAVVQTGSWNSSATAITEGGGYTNTWTALPELNANNHREKVFWARLTSKGPGHTFSHNGGSACIHVALLKGVNPTGNPIASMVQALTHTPGTVTPTQNGSLVLAAVICSNGIMSAVSGGLTIVDAAIAAGGNVGGTMAYLAQATAAAVTPAWSGTGTSFDRAATTIVIAPVAAASPDPGLPTAYQTRVLAAGPSAYWPLDDATGSAFARDLAGTRTAPIAGGVLLGQPGAGLSKAMTLDGTGKLLPATFPSLASQFTLEGWVKQTASQTLMPIMTRQIVADGDFQLETMAGPTRLRFIFRVTSNQLVEWPIALALNAWMHVVVTGAAGSVRAYLNGQPLPAPAIMTLSGAGSGAAGLGCYQPVSTGHWIGSLQDLAVYPRALTAQEVADHYVAQFLPSGLTDSGGSVRVKAGTAGTFGGPHVFAHAGVRRLAGQLQIAKGTVGATFGPLTDLANLPVRLDGAGLLSTAERPIGTTFTRLTALGNCRCRVDVNGALCVAYKPFAGPLGSPAPLLNTLARTDENGSLIVTEG